MMAERDCPTSSCSSRASVRRSSSWARTSRAESACRSARASVVSASRRSTSRSRRRVRAMVASASNMPPSSAIPNVTRSDQRRFSADADKPLLGAIQAALVDLRDPVGDLQHRGAPGNELFVEERVAQPVSLSRASTEKRFAGPATRRRFRTARPRNASCSSGSSVRAY